jgi:PAS domain S-box-containing protein
MTPSPVDAHKQTEAGHAFSYLGILPVLLFIALAVVLRVFLTPTAVFEPPYLLPIANSAFLAIIPFTVAYFAGRSYVMTGSLSILLIGCALLVFGAGNLVAGWVIDLSGPNSTVTIHNIASAVASILYVLAAFAVAEGTTERIAGRRKTKLFSAYFAILLFVALLSAATVSGFMPVFFVVGRGPTPLREAVLTVAVILHVLAAFFALLLYRQRRISLLYWFGLALLLTATGLATVLMQTAVGSAIGWVGRVSQYLGGIYFLAAIIVMVRQARITGTRVEKALASFFRESELHYRKLVETAKVAIISTDGRGQILLWNPTAQEVFGFARKEAVGSGLTDLVGLDGTLMNWFNEEEPAESYAKTMESPLRRKDGSILFAEVSAWTTEVAGGKTTTVVVRDITERKRADEALRQSEERYRSLFSGMTEGFALHEIICDERNEPCDYRFLEINPAFERLTGLKRENVMGRLVSEVLPNLEPYWVKTYGAVALTAQPVQFQNYSSALNKHFEVFAYCPALRQFAVLFVDITERKRAEEALAQARVEAELRLAELQAVLNVAPVAIWIAHDPQCLRITGNRYADEIMKVAYGANISVTALPGDAAVTYRMFRGGAEMKPQELPAQVAAATGKPVAPEMVDLVFSDGRVVTLVMGAVPLFDADGLVRGSVTAGADVTVLRQAEEGLQKAHDSLEARVQERTVQLSQAYEALQREMDERRKAEEQLRQSQKMEAIGTLAGGIAHDFNNILAAILGFTEMAVEDVPDRPLVEKNLRNVLKSAMRARELVKQILAFSRKTTYERSPLSLSSVIKETVHLLRASIPATVEISLSISATSDMVLAAPIEAQQILMNLATNASLAMQEKGGTMEISLADIDFEPDSPVLGPDVAPGEYVQLMVKDTGIGMTPDVMKRVFEPFFTTREVGKGTGMGLAVVYGIAKDLQGTITVESELGVGSTFRVLLPKLKTAAKAEVVEASEVPSGHERILFVDDEDLLAELNSDRLKSLGYEVTTTTSSRDAVDLFQVAPERFDLVITDYTMPHLTGIDLANQLLTIREDIPIILCTGHSDSVSPEIARKNGIREFLMKPLSKQELAEAIRRVLDSKTRA